MNRMSGARNALVASVVGLAVLVPAGVLSGPRDLLLCVSGFPGTTEQAQPTVRGFLDKLGEKLGWGASAVQGDYYPDASVGLQQIRDRDPGFAAMSLDLYLAHGSEFEAKVIARAVMHGRDKQRFHIVVAKEGGPASVDALSGKVLVPFRESARFLGNLVLDGRRALAETLDLQYESNAMSALRKVARGQAVAAVVEEEIIERFDEVPVKDQLTVLLAGPWIPGPPVVGLTGSAEADRTAMQTALIALCGGDGAETCRSIRVDSFKTATDDDYAEVRTLWAR
ncbi:MAG: PhnD/SsuA/transferrin family substrate-binding protein [Deltaproteobacteria bacterium]|nr:PhnD/SsuA/transferrin family substrate-binding protein [Deltaproteobacteria bacterium]